jgi:hypothetical protein
MKPRSLCAIAPVILCWLRRASTLESFVPSATKPASLAFCSVHTLEPIYQLRLDGSAFRLQAGSLALE